jgi:hypothetical protein
MRETLPLCPGYDHLSQLTQPLRHHKTGVPAVVGALDKELLGLDRERYTDGAAGVAGLHDLLGLSEAPGAGDNGKTTGLAAHLDPDLYHFPSILLAMPRTYAAGPGACSFIHRLRSQIRAPLTPTH